MNVDWIYGVHSFLLKYVSPTDRLLLAVSGGADSMGMLALLYDELDFGAGRLVVGHVQHGIRPDESADIELIHAWTIPRSVPTGVRKADVSNWAAVNKLSLEAAARELRYEALFSLAKEYGCQWILTAHTLDDSAETVWMRMQNGGSWYEWSGISAKRGRILRPFIHVNRDKLNNWVHSQGVPYRHDQTNSELRFARNRIRASMQIQGDLWNGQRKQELVFAGESVNKLMEFQRALVWALPMGLNSLWNGRVIGLAIDPIFIYFKGLTFVPLEVVWASLWGNPEARLPATTRRELVAFLRGTGPKADLVLPKNIRVLRRGTTIWITDIPLRTVDVCVGIGRSELPDGMGTLIIAPAPDGHASLLTSNLADRNLRVRTWRAGDRLKSHGRPRKKISDLLNEANIDPVTRENTMVLTDDSGPLLILGGPVDERALAAKDDDKPLTVTWTAHE